MIRKINYLVLSCILLMLVSPYNAEEEFIIESIDDLRIKNAVEPSEYSKKIIDDIVEELKYDFKEETKTLSYENKKTKLTTDVWIPASAKATELDKYAKLSMQVYKKYLEKDSTVALSYNSYNLKLPYPYCPRLNLSVIDCSFNPLDERFYDGSCNNRNNTWFGMTNSPFKRLLVPAYDDYITEPRTKSVVKGKYLPNARKVATVIHESQRTISEWSHFMTYFGQFVDHDLTLTPKASYGNGFIKNCPCGSYDPECFNIPIPNGDKTYYGQKCISFVRSSASIRDFNCNLGPREQLNQQTHWLDLSQVYGFNDTFYELLVDTSTGKMKVSDNDLLPFRNGTTCDLSYTRYNVYSKNRLERCFLAGDDRTEENVMLSALNTIFIREHNKIVDELTTLNPSQDPGDYFSFASHILIAIYQNIVYGEYLPALLGEEMAKIYNLLPLETGFFNKYDETIYPQIINEFATAAFRYGHTFITQDSHTADYNYRYSQSRSIDYYLFNNKAYLENMDGIVKGTLMDWSYAPTAQINTYMNNYLFNNIFYPGSKWSLAALNIQRGRDHGLAPYNKYRKLCGLNYAYSFDELYNIPSHIIAKLKTLYAHVDDIDAFTGMFSEYPLKGGMVGATAGCIIAKQFRDLKFGDRYYFENQLPGSPLSFSETQLATIRNITFAQILCRNVDLTVVQKYVFFTANGYYNTLLNCNDIKNIDYTPWTDVIGPPQKTQ